MGGWTTPLNRITPSALALICLAMVAAIPAYAQVSATFSYYVPQAGTVAAPLEGASTPKSFSFFRACPNNDGSGSLPNNARIKVVARDILNHPIVGISAESICALFSEADSIVAGSPCDTLCPNVRCLTADAPTDTNGVTYITFTGALPANPGVGVRNPNRKWGHYDSKIPVRIGAVEIFGRLTTLSPANSYVLVIRNFDFVGGLSPCIPGEGESVDAADLAALVWCLGGGACPMFFQLDFNWDGVISPSDLNLFFSHFGHNCKFPLDP